MSTVSIYIVFDGMVEKPSVSAFQNFFWIENPLNIKEVMSTNVYVICIDCLTYIALNALEVVMSSVNSVNIYSIYI